jgi:transposase
MLTGMTEEQWTLVVDLFRQVCPRRGERGHDDLRFLQALHYFTVHNITWRALPAEFGHWNSVWKRFWRLSRAGVFEAFFQLLASCSETAALIQMFDSTTARAHVSAAGAKGGSKIRPWAAREAGLARKSTSSATATACRLTLS